MMKTILKTAVIATMLGASVFAVGPTSGEMPRVVQTLLRQNPDRTVVYGTVLDTSTKPVAAATVRLRNLQSKAIEQVGTTSAAGEFAFPAVPDVPYIVELVDRSGRALVVGDIALAHAGAYTTNVLVLPISGLAYGAGVQATAGSIVSAVLGAGLSVLESPAPPLSPEK